MYVDINPEKRISDRSLIGYNTVTQIEAIKNSLRNLFLIPLGGVPGKPWFGNGLYEILFDPMDQFTEKFIREHIKNQLEKYEPRVQLLNIEVISSPEYNKIDVKM
jgi:phage baseplate assembly protein W